MTREIAQQLLNEGFEVWEEGDAFPSRIYNVCQGVIYEAVPAEPGFVEVAPRPGQLPVSHHQDHGYRPDVVCRTHVGAQNYRPYAGAGVWH